MEPVGLQARVTVADIMSDVGYALLEPNVNTTLGTTINPGIAVTVTPPSMTAIYPGAMLIVGSGESREVVTVASVTATTFTAPFQQAHASTDVLTGTTFPSGYPEKQTLTQESALNFISDAQNDFLLRVRPIFSTQLLELTNGNRIYDQSDDAIRVERVSIDEKLVFGCSQRDLDLEDPAWVANRGTPRRWYQDETGTAKLGVSPLPDKGLLADCWYSQRGAATLTIDEDLLVPPIFAHAVKWGALARIWGCDSEIRDPQRAAYAAKRVDLLVALAHRFMDGISIPPPQDRPIARFSPMVTTPVGVPNA